MPSQIDNYTFSIKSFQAGVNEYSAEGLTKPYEAVNASNVDVSNGSFKTTKAPDIYKAYSGNLHSVIASYGTSTSDLLIGLDTTLKCTTGPIPDKTISGSKLDHLNFQDKNTRILICTSKNDIPFYLDNGQYKLLKNRRAKYDEKSGEQIGWIDGNGVSYATNAEESINCYAPKGDFIELHYDRLWIAGGTDNQDRLYFSTAGVNGADINDWTAPTEEAEANMHGGFIDVRSYDGSKIIGLKVVFNSLVIFKNKCAFKLFGSSPSNYQLIQLFSSNGAIADKSICVGNNGAFFLNKDGIYFYDGTNVNLISQKVKNTIASMNLNYADKSVAIFTNNRYYVAFPTGTSTVNNCLIEYNCDTKAFMKHDICHIQDILEYNNKIYISDGTNLRILFEGTTNLHAVWESPYLDFDKKNNRKLSNYIYFRGQGNGVVRFTCTTERKSKVLDVTLDGTEKLYRKKLKNKGRMMKLKIENINNSEATITAPEFMVEFDAD